MGSPSRGISSLVAWSICILVAGRTTTAAAQEPDARPIGAAQEGSKADVKAVDGRTMPGESAQAERALRRIQHRAAGDRTFPKLAGEPIRRMDNATRRTLAIEASTDDQFDIPTTGEVTSVKARGGVGVRVVLAEKLDYDESWGGLYGGDVNWKTNNRHIFVGMDWCTTDLGAPDRLLAIVREELQAEGINLIPMRKLDWPFATTWERLSQLLPPDPPSDATPMPATAPVVPSAEGAFASPQDVVSAFRRATANKDWREFLLCLTPTSRGALFREVLFQTGMGEMTELARFIEKRLKLEIFDEKGHGLAMDTKERQAFFLPPGAPLDISDDAENSWLYESMKNRVGDAVGFLAECMRHFSADPTLFSWSLECEGIRIEGDKASGYVVYRRRPPAPEEVDKDRARPHLPEQLPVRFLRISGSWLIVYFPGQYD